MTIHGYYIHWLGQIIILLCLLGTVIIISKYRHQK